MDDLLSEKEQIEQFRTWWSEYGAYVIGGIVIGAGLLFGINHYQSTQLQTQIDASTAYESLVAHVVDGNLDEAEAVAGEISADFSETTYSGQAGLAMARLYMDKNRDQDAADALLAVINSGSGDEVKHVARLRLARIYLYQEKAQEAVDLLQVESADAFAVAYSEVLGDAYTALGQIAEAQEAYQRVLMDPAAQGAVDQQLVQWKSLDLPEIEEEPEPLSEAMPESGDADAPEAGAVLETAPEESE